jgi:hypothetical protein
MLAQEKVGGETEELLCRLPKYGKWFDQCFVDANNLLTPRFLCAPMFLYILPAPIFLCILPAPIF